MFFTIKQWTSWIYYFANSRLLQNTLLYKNNTYQAWKLQNVQLSTKTAKIITLWTANVQSATERLETVLITFPRYIHIHPEKHVFFSCFLTYIYWFYTKKSQKNYSTRPFHDLNTHKPPGYPLNTCFLPYLYLFQTS